MSEREDKRAQFQQTGKRHPLFWIIGIVAAAGVAAGIVGWKGVGSAGTYPAVSAENDVVSIPAAQLADGKAHFYSYETGGTRIDFFVLKSHDGVVRAALDACDVCYHAKKGYRQEGDSMVCNNCDMKFRSDLINEVKGGCNPAPLNRTEAGGRVTIAAADLAQGAKYFQGQGK